MQKIANFIHIDTGTPKLNDQNTSELENTIILVRPQLFRQIGCLMSCRPNTSGSLAEKP